MFLIYILDFQYDIASLFWIDTEKNEIVLFILNTRERYSLCGNVTNSQQILAAPKG